MYDAKCFLHAKKTLEVADQKASVAEIKSNYRRLVLQLHPDKQQQTRAPTDDPAKNDAAKAFKSVQEAWEVLRDEGKREKYDASLRLGTTHRQI